MNAKFRIKEYCKYIVPFFTGYGFTVHEIAGEKIGQGPLAVEHTFGDDEGLDPFVNLGSIKEAWKRAKNNVQPNGRDEYSFHLSSKQMFPRKAVVEEVKTEQPGKAFRLLWEPSFGDKKKVKYQWYWLQSLMYNISREYNTQRSQLRINYPTGKLVYKVIFPMLYPLDTEPWLVMVPEEGKEKIVGSLKKVDFSREPLCFNLEQRNFFRCYKGTVANPKVGCTYKVVWTTGYKKLMKNLGFPGGGEI